MRSFTQTEPSPWPSGLGEVAAVITLSPEALADIHGLRFFEGSDNLDSYDAAAIRLGSGRRLGLLRHRGSPARGTEVHTDSEDDFVEALREFIDAFELGADDLVWARPEVPLSSLRLTGARKH